MDLVKTQRNWERPWKGFFNSEELEKAFEGLGNKLEEIFEGIEETK